VPAQDTFFGSSRSRKKTGLMQSAQRMTTGGLLQAHVRSFAGTIDACVLCAYAL